MTRATLRALLTAIFLLLMASCDPAGCYGPRAFNYNTTGVAVSNLVGTYTFDGTNAAVLSRYGFTNHSGVIRLLPDMTFAFSNVPCIVGLPKPGVYSSSGGKWRAVKTAGIWEVELYDADPEGIAGFSTLSLPVLGSSPPHGLELTINHDEGYWVRYRHSPGLR
jgi:hypothetical protein